MISADADFTSGLEAFAEQFLAEMANAGPPSSEHAIHFCLALGFQAAYDLKPGAILFEWPQATKRIDLWVAPFELAVEVKFRRPIPSGRNLPATQLFGQLLADLNKVALAGARNRMVVFVTDPPGMTYLRNSSLLPLQRGDSRDIMPEQVDGLATSASVNALSAGRWTPLAVELLWARDAPPWQLLAWRVSPLTAG